MKVHGKWLAWLRCFQVSWVMKSSQCNRCLRQGRRAPQNYIGQARPAHWPIRLRACSRRKRSRTGPPSPSQPMMMSLYRPPTRPLRAARLLTPALNHCRCCCGDDDDDDDCILSTRRHIDSWTQQCTVKLVKLVPRYGASRPTTLRSRLCSLRPPTGLLPDLCESPVCDCSIRHSPMLGDENTAPLCAVQSPRGTRSWRRWPATLNRFHHNHALRQCNVPQRTHRLHRLSTAARYAASDVGACLPASPSASACSSRCFCSAVVMHCMLAPVVASQPVNRHRTKTIKF